MFGRHHPVVVMTLPPFVLGGPSALCQRKKIRFLTIQGAKGLVIQGRTVNGSDRCFSDGHAGASLLLDGRSGGSSVFELALDSIVVIDSEVVLSGSDFCAAGEQQLTVRAIRSRVVVEYARFSSFSLVLSEWSKLAGNSFVSAKLGVQFSGSGSSVTNAIVRDQLDCHASASNNSLSAVVGERTRVHIDNSTRRFIALDLRSVRGEEATAPPVFPYRLDCGIVIPPPSSVNVIWNPISFPGPVRLPPVLTTRVENIELPRMMEPRPAEPVPMRVHGDEGDKCTVCLVEPADIATVPCGHRVFCSGCLPEARRKLAGGRCPVCKTHLRDTIHVQKKQHSPPS